MKENNPILRCLSRPLSCLILITTVLILLGCNSERKKIIERQVVIKQELNNCDSIITKHNLDREALLTEMSVNQTIYEAKKVLGEPRLSAEKERELYLTPENVYVLEASIDSLTLRKEALMREFELLTIKLQK